MLSPVKICYRNGLYGLVLALGAIQPHLAMADDLASGKAVFERDCSACHTVNKGGSNIMGPNLFGIIGRKTGSLEGFSYSQAMKNNASVWDRGHLEAFLAQPQAAMPGTYMFYTGLSSEQERKALSLWLSQQR